MTMKKQLHELMNEGRHGSDDFQTPREALAPLLPYLRRFKCVWDPCCGKGNLVFWLRHSGLSAVGTDIKSRAAGKGRIDFRDGTEGLHVVDDDVGPGGGLDFLDFDSPLAGCDVVVTNPPYSTKDLMIAQCCRLGLPFALLLPLMDLEGVERQRWWRQGVELLVLAKRAHFETPSGEDSHPWFAAGWFCRGLLPEKLMFG